MRIPLIGRTGSGKENSAGSGSFVSKHPGMVLCLLLTLLIALLHLNHASLFESYESRFIDFMFNIRGTIEPSGQVVMLEIDDKSIDHLGAWPWNHQTLAQLIEALHYYSPSSVVLHFPIADRMNDFVSGNSQLLAENILQSGNVILPFYPILSDRTPRTSTAADWLRSSALTSVIPFQAEETPRASRLEFPSDLFAQSGKMMGADFTRFEDNNRVRVQPLILMYEKLFYPSIELAAAASAQNIQLDEIEFDQDKMEVQIGMQSVPVDRRGYYMINYYGPASSIPSFSVKDFWDGEVDISKLQDKIVVIAVTASGLSDVLYTSFSDRFTPVEKSATVIDNILSGRFITPLSLPSTARLIGILVMGVLCSVLMPRMQLTHRYILLSLLAIGLISFSIIMFVSYDTIVRIVHPALELFLFALVAPMMTERRKVDQTAESTSRTKTVPKPAISSPAKGVPEIPRKERHAQKPAPPPISQPVDTQDYQETSLPADFEQAQIETRMLDELAKATGETDKSDSRANGDSSRPKDPKSASDKIPSSFGRYTVTGKLGKGAMGTVYKGMDPAIDRPVALKTILLDRIADESEIDELRERLTREAKAAGSLSHPNIVTIYDVGQDGDTQYIAMEYLEGHTLEQIINRQLEFNFRLAAKIVFQICSALSYAHRHGIVHRDIKPANIMVMENFHVKVMDFGIARFESSSLTQTGIAMGTPNYISPEQLKGEEVTLSSDIFSLGVVFYEMLAGRKPFVGDNISNLILKIINDNPPLPSTYSDKIPAMLDIIVKKSLEKNPYDRYQSAEEMMRTLEDFAMGFSASRSRL
ncbi:MAG: serine/threonine-protein kinase [Candidatus Zixiibacteriota bacterium]